MTIFDEGGGALGDLTVRGGNNELVDYNLEVNNPTDGGELTLEFLTASTTEQTNFTIVSMEVYTGTSFTEEVPNFIKIPEVLAYNDYFPYGSLLPNRHGQSQNYRYGYQGSEKDNEVAGEGNSYTTHWRQYDSRIGRWKSIDPKAEKYPDLNPYNYSANNPLFFIDIEGDTIKFSNLKTKALYDAYIKPIKATKLGEFILNRLENSEHVYTINEKGVNPGWSASYEGDINFGIINSNGAKILDNDGSPRLIFANLGHEIFHAFQFDALRSGLDDPDDFTPEVEGKMRDFLEDGAVQFENYLYKSYGYDNIRKQYSGRKIDNPTKFNYLVDKPMPKNSATDKKQHPVSVFFIFVDNDEVPLPDDSDIENP